LALGSIPVYNNWDIILLLLLVFCVYTKMARYVKDEKVTDILDISNGSESDI
jgi:hypothetical protein